MCDLSGKLIPWLDHELPLDEAADVQLHLQTCADCRRCLATYRHVSDAIDACCDAAIQSSVRQWLPTWTPVLAAAAAVVFLIVAQGRIARGPAELPPASAPVTVDSSPALVHPNEGQPEVRAALNPPPTPAHKRARKVPPVSPLQNGESTQQTQGLNSAQNASWIPAQAAVEIAIPAEAMFAPGAVPQGVSLSAELIIAADGSAQQLRLRP